MSYFEVDYLRKPSKPQLVAAIRKGLSAGNDLLHLTWGENRIEVRVTQYGVFGSGWIGRNGGDDLVRGMKK